MNSKKISVYGAGAFGTAMALTSLRAGHKVTLVSRTVEKAEKLKKEGLKVLGWLDIPLPDSLMITAEIEKLAESDIIFLAIPAQSLYSVLENLRSAFSSSTPLILCGKGIDRAHQLLLSDVAQQQVSNPIALLSGPSFAVEIARNHPAAVMLAAKELGLAIELSQLLRHINFRCYASDDVVGVQIAGAVKNVIAIAAGIVEGRNFGANSRAALLARGLAEMCRLGLAMGAKQETFLGLAGMGDLILTGTSDLSRNFYFGKLLGQSLSKIYAEEQMAGKVVEGYATAEVLKTIADQYQVRMPICQNVYELLYTHKPLDDIIEGLLSRQADVEI